MAAIVRRARRCVRAAEWKRWVKGAGAVACEDRQGVDQSHSSHARRLSHAIYGKSTIY